MLQASQGRAFLLFASHRALREAAEALRDGPWPLFVQGEAPRATLLQRFRESGNGVLLGSASFREGVDVVGEALSVVMIDKLPFAPPNDPLTAARIVALVNRYDNLLVIHTLSKSRSLAGLRVGFAVGHPALIEALERVKNSFNSYPLDRVAIVGAVAAMEDEAYFADCCRQVVATRDRLTADLGALGFTVLPSAANFIFAHHPQRDAAELAKALRERSIIVRHFKLPRIDQFLRITVGTDGECRALTAALREILA